MNQTPLDARLGLVGHSSESTTVLALRMEFGFMKNYTYLVFREDGGGAVVIDPAWQMAAISDALARHRLRLEAVLVTHAHLDHVNLVRPLVNRFDCDVWMCASEPRSAAIPGGSVRELHSEDAFEAAGLAVRPIFTPGHTRGSTCFLIDGSLFSGDTLFIEGCGMCFGPNPDPGSLYRSLTRLKEALPLETRIYPGHSYGHDPGKTLAFVLKHNVYLHFRNERDFVAYRMRKNQKNFFRFS